MSGAAPSAEKTRFANSGTETTIGAIRIARGYAREPTILKFAGHFHGTHDYLPGRDVWSKPVRERDLGRVRHL